MKIKRLALLIVLLVTLAGCNLPGLSVAAGASNAQAPRSYKLVTAGPDATATPTPFQPMASTARPTVAPTSVTPEPTKEPAQQATLTVAQGPTRQPAMGRYPDGQVRILVLGSDARPTGGFRTDIIILVTINPKQGTVTALSFPRDLWVNLPGWGTNRINTAMVYGGFSLMASTLESNFGVRPTHYIMTNFNGFTQIVDSLGGVDVTASQTLIDKCKFDKSGTCTVNPGVTHMNGAYALWYVRSRYSTSDFDRERRSQEVLQALFAKLMNANAIARIPELFEIYKKNVETNLSLNDIVSLAGVAPGLIADKSKIRRYTIGSGQVSNYTVPGSGAMVLLPNATLIRQIIMDAVFTP